MVTKADLIQAIALTQDDVAQNRASVKDGLVRATLSQFKLGQSFTAKSVQASIQQGVGILLPIEAITVLLEGLKNSDYLSTTNKGNYAIHKRIPFHGVEAATDSLWKDFIEFSLREDPDFDPYLHGQSRTVLEFAVLELLCGGTTSVHEEGDFDLLFRLFTNQNGKPGQEADIKLLRHICSLAMEYLRAMSDPLRVWLDQHFSVAQYIDLIEKESVLEQIDFDHIEFVVLDTTVLVAALCSTHESHALVSCLLTVCEARGIGTVFFPETVEEMQRLIDGSKHEMSGLQPRRNASTIESQFVKECIYNDFAWHTFVVRVESWAAELKAQFGVRRHPGDPEPDPAIRSIYGSFIPVIHEDRKRERLRRNPDLPVKDKGPDQVNHDANCLGRIQALRIGGSQERGPWFLTLDRVLLEADRRHAPLMPLAVHCRAFLEYLTLYAPTVVTPTTASSARQAIVRHIIGHPRRKHLEADYLNYTAQRLQLEKTQIPTLKKIIQTHPLGPKLSNAIKRNRRGEADQVFQTVALDEAFIDKVLRNDELKKTLDRLVRENEELKKKNGDPGPRALSVQLSQNTSVEVNQNVVADFDSDFNDLLALLRAVGALDEPKLGAPPESTDRPGRMAWLRRGADLLKDGTIIADGARATLPVFARLIKHLEPML